MLKNLGQKLSGVKSKLSGGAQEITDRIKQGIKKGQTNGSKQSMQIQPQLQTQMQEEDPVEVKPKKQNAFKLRPQAQTQTSASGSGEESGNTDIQNKEKRTLEIVNVSAMIDLFAEQQALQEFDQEMHAHTQKGRIKGLFARWYTRVGRGANIEARKKQIKQDLEVQLTNGNLTVDEIKNFVSSNEVAIYSQSFLTEEQTQKGLLDNVAKQILTDEILRPGISPVDRKVGIQKLRSLLQSTHAGLKIELTQMERAIAEIESSLAGVDLKTLEIGLNLYDSGRIGDQKGGRLQRLRDGLQGGKGTRAMDWMDKKILNFAKNPTIAAIISALGVQALFGRTLASFGGGLVTGSLVGGALAGGRASQESRDHVQIALRAYAHSGTYQANPVYKQTIDAVIQAIGGKSAEGFLQALSDPAKSLEEKKTLAQEYYARRLATRDTGYNFLLYPDANATNLNITILQTLNALGLGRTWSETQENASAITAMRLMYQCKADRAQDITLEDRQKHALKQGAIYGGSAFAVGGALGAIQWGVSSAYDAVMGGADTSHSGGGGSIAAVTGSGYGPLNPSVIPSVPGQIQAAGSMLPTPTPSIPHTGAWSSGHSTIETIGRTWLDNGSPSPNFDGNELRIWGTNDGGLSISGMIGQGSTFEKITDLVALDDQSTYAIVTIDGVHYRVDIDTSGNLLPDDDMRTILSERSFETLEIAHQKPDGTHNIFATLKGDASGVYIPSGGSSTIDPQSIMPLTSPSYTLDTPIGADQPAAIPAPQPEIGIPSPETTKDPEIIPPAAFAPWALPIGGTPYHEGAHRPPTRPRDPLPRGPVSTPPSRPLGGPTDSHDQPKSTHESSEEYDQNSPNSGKITLPNGTFMGQTQGNTPLIPYLPSQDTSMHIPKTPSTQPTLEDLKNEANQYWDEIVNLRSIIAGKTDGKQMFSETDLANMKATEDLMLKHYHDKLRAIKERESVASTQQAIKSSTQSAVTKTLDLNQAENKASTKKPDTSRVAKTNESADADKSIDSLDQELSTLESQLRAWFVKNRIKNIAAFADNLKSLEERKKTLTEAQQKKPGNTNITGDLLLVEQGLKEYGQIAELLAKKRTLIEQYRDKAQKDGQYAGFLQEAGLTSWEKAEQKLKKLQTKKAAIDELPGEKKRKEKAAKKLAIFEEMIKTHQTINDINKWIGSYDQAFDLDTTKKAESSSDTTKPQETLKMTQLLPEVIKYQEKIKVNHSLYTSTGDRTYLRFNEEILKDIARAEGKSSDQYEIKDGLIIRK